MLKKCLVEIWKCEPQSLLMAFGLALMEALIPLGSALLSVFLINGLEAGRIMRVCWSGRSQVWVCSLS